jgi:hypothetical protein
MRVPMRVRLRVPVHLPVTAALHTVRESAGPAAGPIPVLVQPMVRSRAGGVLFGADPVAGRADRLLVSVVRGGPDSLVSGVQPGSNLRLSPRGRMLAAEASEPLAAPGPDGHGLLNERERIARASVRPVGRARLADRLTPLAAPSGGLLGDHPDLPGEALPSRARQRAPDRAGRPPGAGHGHRRGPRSRRTHPHRTPAARRRRGHHRAVPPQGKAVDDARTELGAHQPWNAAATPPPFP